MNPCSQAEKIALVKVLNEADLDPSTGTQRGLSIGFFELIWAIRNRGHIGTPFIVPHSVVGDGQERDQGFGAELF
jgi:hypothetical protein